VPNGAVRFRPEIEPLVRLLEDSPRERLLEEVARKIRSGVSYQEVLAALLLAGIRNVQPRPHVGYKFHAVLVVNSAHLASLASPDSQRWLPIFWALDHFKSAQAQDEREGNWTMAAVDESKVPARNARSIFVTAMNTWDEPAADAAVAALARNSSSAELFDLFCGFAPRDFRSIGHKIIFLANSWRTLNCVGWQHAEPVLRSLAYALLNHHGEPNPSTSDLPADRPGRENRDRYRAIRADWLEGTVDTAATSELVATLRDASDADACDVAVEMINRGVSPKSIWDAAFAGAAELLVRQPGIVSLHAVTTTNAAHYCFRHCREDEIRRWLMLQNLAFLPLFRAEMAARGTVGLQQLDKIEPLPSTNVGPQAVEEILADVSRDRSAAARKTLAYLKSGGDPQALIDAARLLVFFKGDDSHDYKFSSAAMEDYYHAGPDWRDRFLAASMFRLHGSFDRENPLVARTRAALGA
jgi:hypothetical protein